MWTHMKGTSKSALLALCEGNSPVTGEFTAQRASNAEKASIWWRHHECRSFGDLFFLSLNKSLNKLSSAQWFDILARQKKYHKKLCINMTVFIVPLSQLGARKSSGTLVTKFTSRKRMECTWKCYRYYRSHGSHFLYACSNYINPGYGLSLVDTLWNASSYRQPLEQEGNPIT